MEIKEKILVIDFGSQLTQLIARRLRDNGIYSEIIPYNVSIEKIKNHYPKGIILSGGPSSVKQQSSPKITMDIFKIGVPILGICYGQQLLCELLGGEVESSDHREFGKANLEILKESVLLENVWNNQSPIVWMSHGDRVSKLPKGFKIIAKTDNAPNAVIANNDKQIYGVQFHPEVSHTINGEQILCNFANKICSCGNKWNLDSFLEDKIKEIKDLVGKEKVICGVSGGVDSSVVATLLHRAIGKQLSCIFVNTGLLRKNESDQVIEIFDQLDIPLTYVDSEINFVNNLKGITDPEKKRKIIGKSFIEVFEREANKINGAKFLAQGTLYSDVIESSATGLPSVTIKSHHNVGGLPQKLNFKLIEPLKDIFKDEVRDLGTKLGLPEDIINRHPFPGPGLAVRIIGEVTREKLAILREADDIYINELKNFGLYNKIWQAFAILTAVKTVGVMGDGRSYEYVCALRAVNSEDGMTADFYPFEHDFLSTVSNKITNHVKGINRIVYDITSKPPGTIEWE